MWDVTCAPPLWPYYPPAMHTHALTSRWQPLTVLICFSALPLHPRSPCLPSPLCPAFVFPPCALTPIAKLSVCSYSTSSRSLSNTHAHTASCWQQIPERAFSFGSHPWRNIWFGFFEIESEGLNGPCRRALGSTVLSDVSSVNTIKCVEYLDVLIISQIFCHLFPVLAEGNRWTLFKLNFVKSCFFRFDLNVSKIGFNHKTSWYKWSMSCSWGFARTPARKWKSPMKQK